MTADHLSYQRAVQVSLLGLVIQVVVGLALLLYAVQGGDPAAMSGALATACGIPIWIALALVFNQHRLERLEAMEVEAYRASAAAQASVFEEAGADQQVQASRLAWMHRWFLPAMSLLIAGVYIGVGLFLYNANKSYPHVSPFKAPPASGWAIAIGVVVAVVGFIFARFVAGMAKQPVWQLLHAGSGAAVASSLIALGLAVAHFFVSALDSTLVMRYLPLAIDAMMIALGAEMAMNFVLNLYRPRRAGVYLRPGFDSRVLAFIAAPDRLAKSISDAVNYQFGFNVSSTWFYRLLSRSVGSLALLAVLLIWGMSVVSIVKPDEKGLKITNGKLSAEVGAGLVWKLPWPFSKVETFPASAVNEINVGTGKPTAEGPILWTNAHTAVENYFLVQPGREGGGSAGSGGMALIAAEVPIHYVVSDLRKYTQLAQDDIGADPQRMRQALLRAEASSVVTEHLATHSVQEVLGASRGEIASSLARDIQAAWDTLNDGQGSGAQVIFVGLNGVHPERETAAPAFEAVVQADAAKQKTIQEAESAANIILANVVGDYARARTILAELDVLNTMKSTKASEGQVVQQEQKVMDLILNSGGEAATIISTANANRWKRHMGERARAIRSEGQIAAYRAAPRAYRIDAYLIALRDAAQAARVWIVPFQSVRVRMDSTEVQPDISGFEADLEKNQK